MKRIALMTGLLLLASWSAVAVAQDAGVARAQFTTAIEDREPVDQVHRLGTEHDRVVFFTELRGLEGRRVTHRWVHDGEVEARVDFEVGGPRWRVWSSKDLIPEWSGTWIVEVVDDEGTFHGSWDVTYGDDMADSDSGE